METRYSRSKSNMTLNNLQPGIPGCKYFIKVTLMNVVFTMASNNLADWVDVVGHKLRRVSLRPSYSNFSDTLHKILEKAHNGIFSNNFMFKCGSSKIFIPLKLNGKVFLDNNYCITINIFRASIMGESTGIYIQVPSIDFSREDFSMANPVGEYSPYVCRVNEPVEKTHMYFPDSVITHSLFSASNNLNYSFQDRMRYNLININKDVAVSAYKDRALQKQEIVVHTPLGCIIKPGDNRSNLYYWKLVDTTDLSELVDYPHKGIRTWNNNIFNHVTEKLFSSACPDMDF